MEFILTKKWTGNINVRQNHLNSNTRFKAENGEEFDNFLKSLKEGDKIVIKKDEMP